MRMARARTTTTTTATTTRTAAADEELGEWIHIEEDESLHLGD